MGSKFSTLKISHIERDLYLLILEILSANNFSLSNGKLSKTNLKKFPKWILSQFPDTNTETITKDSICNMIGKTLYNLQTNQDFSVTVYMPLFHVITKAVEKSNKRSFDCVIEADVLLHAHEPDNHRNSSTGSAPKPPLSLPSTGSALSSPSPHIPSIAEKNSSPSEREAAPLLASSTGAQLAVTAAPVSPPSLSHLPTHPVFLPSR